MVRNEINLLANNKTSQMDKVHFSRNENSCHFNDNAIGLYHVCGNTSTEYSGQDVLLRPPLPPLKRVNGQPHLVRPPRGEKNAHYHFRSSIENVN